MRRPDISAGPSTPAVGAARPHGVPTPTSNITDDCELIPYREHYNLLFVRHLT